MFNIGADYYPEHWSIDEGEERWDIDGKLMEEAGFNITRMAEFAWAKLEPNEGEFDFSWLDRAVEALGKHGVKSILCTPTPTMPKWIYDKYNEAVAVDSAGNKLLFGNRQINCFTSDVYRSFSRRITRELAEHYRDNKNVVAWQLDNEFWGPNCYCHQCENKFRKWLEKKYKNIDALNKEYGTIFWSHSYRSFDEVHLPRHSHSSPSLYLDYKRFHSENVVSFARGQEEILRGINSSWTITHNLMGFAPNIDYYELGKSLDVAAFDYYFTSSFDDSSLSKIDLYRTGAAALDLTRSVKRKNFWIMENNAGAAGWETYGRNLVPGEIRRMTYQNIAHGCDTQIWFRFRTSRYGTEQYWHGLLGHDGKKGRRFNEAKETSAELHRLFEEMENTGIEAPVAIMYDYDDRWAFEQQPNSKDFNYVTETVKFHKAFSSRGVNVDFVSTGDCINNYKILVLPAKYILEKPLAEKVEDFVKSGGTLITTYRSGVKNDANVPHALTLPGYLRQVTGVRVEEYETVGAASPYTVKLNGQKYRADTLADWVIPETAKTVASYDNKYVNEYAAVTENSFGRGKAYYIGTVLELDALKVITDRAIDELNIDNFGDLPEGLEIVTRSNSDEEFVFVINHTEEPQTVKLTGSELITGNIINSELFIEENNVKVIRRKKFKN